MSVVGDTRHTHLPGDDTREIRRFRGGRRAPLANDSNLPVRFRSNGRGRDLAPMMNLSPLRYGYRRATMSRTRRSLVFPFYPKRFGSAKAESCGGASPPPVGVSLPGRARPDPARKSCRPLPQVTRRRRPTIASSAPISDRPPDLARTKREFGEVRDSSIARSCFGGRMTDVERPAPHPRLAAHSDRRRTTPPVPIRHDRVDRSRRPRNEIEPRREPTPRHVVAKPSSTPTSREDEGGTSAMKRFVATPFAVSSKDERTASNPTTR